MFNNIALQLVSFAYLAILSIIYFTKRNYNFLESKVYKVMLVMTMITIVFDSVNILTEENIYPLGFFYRACLYSWLVLFISYTFLSCKDKKYEKLNVYVKENKLSNIWMISVTALFVFLALARINYSLRVIYIFGIIGVILDFIILLIKIRKIPKYKKWSIILSDIIIVGTIIIQMNNDHIDIIGPSITLITLVQYLIMENPDLKYIDELNGLKNKAEEANDAKNNFLASMSHEIRTPMNVIIGLSNSLLEEEVPSEMKEDIKNISEASNVLLEIVNNLMDVARVDDAKNELNNKPYSLADTLAKISHMVEISLMDKPIKFELKVNGNLPASLMGDELKVNQVLSNILSNSIKYTKKGTIKLIVDSNIIGNKDYLTFKISDTGIGIKKQDNDKLFQEFERLDQEKSDIQGSGLGLVITKQLVNILGGKISFNSVYGEGTTFTINLEQEIINKETVDFDSFHSKKVSVDEYFDGSSYKVLVVDDNILNLKVAEKMLKKYNFNITSVKSGLECINYTKNNNYDIIFMDHMMPGMDGIQTLYNLKKRATGFDTPVVVLTANVSAGSKKLYLQEGFCDYLSKPIDQIELDRILREQLKIDNNTSTIKDNSSSNEEVIHNETPSIKEEVTKVVDNTPKADNIFNTNNEANRPKIEDIFNTSNNGDTYHYESSNNGKEESKKVENTPKVDNIFNTNNNEEKKVTDIFDLSNRE